MSRRYRRPGLLLLILQLQACYSWQPAGMPIDRAMRGGPEQIRITTASGTVRVLEEPRLIGDSITTAAFLDACPREEDAECPNTEINGEPLEAWALDEITTVEYSELSAGRTTVTILLSAVAFIAIMVCADDGDSLIEFC
jgi:hypothetical protein